MDGLWQLLELPIHTADLFLIDLFFLRKMVHLAVRANITKWRKDFVPLANRFHTLDSKQVKQAPECKTGLR